MKFSLSTVYFLTSIVASARACDHDHHDHHRHDPHNDHSVEGGNGGSGGGKSSRKLRREHHGHALQEAEVREYGERRTCGAHDPTEAEQAQIEQDVADYKARYGSAASALTAGSTIDIDVYFHNIYRADSTEGFLTDAEIEAQMDVLNKAFGGEDALYNGCANMGDMPTTSLSTPFRFILKEIRRERHNEYFEGEDNGDSITSSYRIGDCSTLNIFTKDTDYLGWANFPSSCSNDGVTGDGVFLNYLTLPDGSITDYDQGDTAIHEVGHWLGLYHTFQNGCSGTGDSVADTPAEESPAFGCAIGRDTCASGGLDPIHNFMDYSDDCCMFSFSPNQSERMQEQWQVFRAPAEDSPTNTPTSPPTSKDPCVEYPQDSFCLSPDIVAGGPFKCGLLPFLKGPKLKEICEAPAPERCDGYGSAVDVCFKTCERFKRYKFYKQSFTCSYLSKQEPEKKQKHCKSNDNISGGRVCFDVCGTCPGDFE
jgi:hypothetical protein